MEALALFLPLL